MVQYGRANIRMECLGNCVIEWNVRGCVCVCRMVSCGRDNIRLWRVKDGQLRSAPVNLGDYHSAEFTDCCFEAGHKSNKDPLDRTV